MDDTHKDKEESSNAREENQSDAKATYEARKAARQEEKASQRHASKRGSGRRVLGALLGVLAGIAVIAFGVWALMQAFAPQGDDFSREISIMGGRHIAVGAGHVPYNSNPPTSGPHYAVLADTGFRPDAPADEHIVHNLEHGDIWISYHPDVSEEVIDVLREFTDDPRVILTPRSGNDKDIALAAWGRLDTFDLENDALDEDDSRRVSDFIKRYKNKGPEKVPPQTNGGV